MTAEKPEGDVASPLRELADAHAVAAFYVRGSSDIRDAIVKQAVRIESQATRIETLTEAINAFLAKYDELEPVVLGMTVRCYGPDGYKGKTWGVELAALRALSAGQGEG